MLQQRSSFIAQLPLAGGIAANGLRHPVPHPNPSAYERPVKLLRQVTPPGGLAYRQTSFWEERCVGRVQRTTIEKTIRIRWEQERNERAMLIYGASSPVLHKSDLSAFEKSLLLLAQLYQRLEIDATSTGQLLGLRNHAEVLMTWTELQKELIQRSGGNDEITQLLLEAVHTQMQRPESLLISLRHDYAFDFALPRLYGQRFESTFRYEQAREFPHFFTDTGLRFTERLEVAAPLAAGRATLRLTGLLDTTRTDLSAVATHIQAALAVAAAPVAVRTAPGTLTGQYEATYDVDLATGWPVEVEASVRCAAGDAYQKEYFLRLEQLPPA